jgi:GTP-binding protein
MGGAFLRHVQRCRVLLHLIDGTSDDPVGDFRAINRELELYDECLAQKPQVVVLNKIDVSEVKEREEDILAALREAAGHSRVLSISAATTERVQELMSRLRKFVAVQPEPDLPPPAEIDLSLAGLDYDSDDYEIISDPSYPGQWRISGKYIEQIARMTHWEYPEALERFGRQLVALGISAELIRRGAEEGDLVMVDEYDFDFSPRMTNPYVPQHLLDEDAARYGSSVAEEEELQWRPFAQGGYLDVDTEEFVGFNDDGEWDLLDDDEDNLIYDDDEIWSSTDPEP